MCLTAEQLSEICPDDAQRYFAHTFYRFSTDGGKVWEWAHAGAFKDSTGSGIGTTVSIYATTNGGKSAVHKLQETGTLFDFRLPPSRVYNFKGNTVTFARLPHRQYKKGLCSATMQITSIMDPFAYKMSIIPKEIYEANNFDLNVDNLNLLFYKMAPIPLEKCLSSILKHQAFSRTLDGEVLLSQGILSKNPSVWHRSTLAGEYDVKADRVVVKRPSLLEEIAPIFNEMSLPVVVA